MMNQKMKLGIWLDYKEAIILIAHKKSVDVITTIASEIEDFHMAGGAPAKVKWGLGEVVSDKKYLERRKNQERDYFDKLIAAVRNADEIFLFGPAEAKFGLQTRIKNLKNFKPVFRHVKTADQMTENQKKAMVRSYYD